MLEANDGKMKIRLPKTLNKATGHETTTPYQFSVQKWNSHTNSYKQSIERRGPVFTCQVFAEVQTRRNQKHRTTDTDDMGTGNNVDPYAYLCIPPPPLAPMDRTDHRITGIFMPTYICG